MRRPILFLDFDGVLNHHRTPTRHTFPSGVAYLGIDPRNVARLNHICEAVPEMRIVVSSAWRTSYDAFQLGQVLAEQDFLYPDRIIGVTPTWVDLPVFRREPPCRGDEIQAWIDRQPEGERPTNEEIAILDDMEDLGHLDGRLVRTDMYDGGMRDAEADRVIALLSESARRAA